MKRNLRNLFLVVKKTNEILSKKVSNFFVCVCLGLVWPNFLGAEDIGFFGKESTGEVRIFQIDFLILMYIR